jgi:nitrite reductase/ring-hydroxylating ferredoxin subunit
MMRLGVFGILLTFLMLGCRQNNRPIPNVPVDLAINIQNPEYQTLYGVGSWVYVSGGSKGIIIFRASAEEFKAYDRHCTYQPDSECALAEVEDNNLVATCCGSSFQLLDGSPISGPATIGLQQYNTSFDGNIIRVWN